MFSARLTPTSAGGTPRWTRTGAPRRGTAPAAPSTAAARRLIKFLGWVKLIDGFAAASKASGALRQMLYAHVSLSIIVDVMRDAVTLDKLGLLITGLPGLRGWNFARLNEAVDALLATLAIAVGALRLHAATVDDQARALRLSVFKSVCHLGKACDAGKLGGGPGDRIGALCGLLNSLMTVRDLRTKLTSRR